MFHKTNTFTFYSISKNSHRFINFFCSFYCTIYSINIMSINFNDIPIKCFNFIR